MIVQFERNSCRKEFFLERHKIIDNKLLSEQKQKQKKNKKNWNKKKEYSYYIIVDSLII